MGIELKKLVIAAAPAKDAKDGQTEHKDEGFNPVAELYDRDSVFKTLDFETGGKVYHGTAFVDSWNGATPSFLHLSQHVFQIFWATLIVLIIGLYVTLLRNSRIPRGLRNFIEPIALFIRNEVARPNIRNYHPHHDHGEEHKHDDHGHGPEHKHDDHGHGHEHKHDDHGHEKENEHATADKFAPFLLATFLFIATINLLGLIPGSTTPTSAWSSTVGFAAITLTTYLVGAILLQGPKAWVMNLVPYQFSTKPLDLAIWILLLGIELVGLVTKPFALTVRLFANMTAGHCVILSLLFINQLVATLAGGYWPLASGVPTVLMSVAIYGLEIFVSILQAYIFTYLSAIFIGGYLAPEH
ncbi:MAG: F0F1 ATP synthase subunit A [Planctomycetaceae bacterium]|nr:F0F1 ATP synthase subunit A [Planctomycetaceae bacterium]